MNVQYLLVLVLPVRKRPVFEEGVPVVGGHDHEGIVEPEALLDEPKEPRQTPE